MTTFTDRENDELLACIKYLKGRDVIPIDPLEPSIRELQAPAVRKNCPLKTAAEAILLNDMFASFLSSGKSGHVIAASGGFGADGQYHVVGAGNTGMRGVRRPSDELCAVLAQACTKFISGNTKPLNPDAMSGILVASLDICHAEVTWRLKTIKMGAKYITPTTSNMGIRDERGLQLHSQFHMETAALKGHLEKWKRLESQEKIKVATRYGQLLGIASDLWDKIKDFGTIQSNRQMRHIHELNTIARGLHLLRGFHHSTRVVFDWPQGPSGLQVPASAKTAKWQTVIENLINKSAIADHELRKQMRKEWKEAIQWEKTILHMDCQLHCEIYLALHILFSESNVRFHSFLVTERKRVFTIGCSKASCIGCWDILLGLLRQDWHDHPIHVCRTRYAHGKSYSTWGLTPHVETLPPSLRQAVTGAKQTQMLKSLNDALKCSHDKFKQRVESSM
jgi:hypothetical protein